MLVGTRVRLVELGDRVVVRVTVVLDVAVLVTVVLTGGTVLVTVVLTGGPAKWARMAFAFAAAITTRRDITDANRTVTATGPVRYQRSVSRRRRTRRTRETFTAGLVRTSTYLRMRRAALFGGHDVANPASRGTRCGVRCSPGR